MTPGGYVPDRGDAVWITLGPRAGSEQAWRRPALVVSPLAYNAKVGLAIMCPITSRATGYPFEVVIDDGEGVSGAVLADQVKSLDWRERQAELICRVARWTVDGVLDRLTILLDRDHR